MLPWSRVAVGFSRKSLSQFWVLLNYWSLEIMQLYLQHSSLSIQAWNLHQEHIVTSFNVFITKCFSVLLWIHLLNKTSCVDEMCLPSNSQDRWQLQWAKKIHLWIILFLLKCLCDWHTCLFVCVRSGDFPVWGLVQPPPGPAEPPQQGHKERWQDWTQLISFLYSLAPLPSVTSTETGCHDRFGCVVGGKPWE